MAAGTAPSPAAATLPAEAVAPDPAEGTDDTADDGEDGDEGDGEAEAHTGDAAPKSDDHLYTSDISDADLEKLWKENRKALEPISVGFTDAGRLINGERFPADGPWVVVDPPHTYGTRETNDYLIAAIRAVDSDFPGGPPARLNHIGAEEGGYLRPHHSHQAGRDVDIGFYYRNDPPARVASRAKYMDLERNWSLIRSIVTLTDVQFILVDRSIQKVLFDYALSRGEDRGWLDSLFHAGSNSILKHARHHRDHFHVRFYNPRAQELGRRIQPLLAKSKDEHSIVQHHIRQGDSLGRIAVHYGVSITALKKANGLKSAAIRAGRVLLVPVRGACVNCPIPPPVIVPPRRLPPEKAEGLSLNE